MDRCAQAYQYHRTGWNCAQSVAAAFADLTDFTPEQVAAMAAGFGGGVGGSRSELCGAISGGVMVLGLLYPHINGEDTAAKRHVYGLTKTFLARFQERFEGLSRCGDLLHSAIQATPEHTPAAVRVGADTHCDILIVTAVEVLEELLAEQAKA